MAQPTPYTRAYNLASVQSGNSLLPIPGSYLDTELDAVKNTLDQTLANLVLIQRDDGALKNGIVGVASLSSDVKALMAAGANIEGPWVTATVYEVGAIVEESSIAYMCLIEHTSGTFATDLSNGKWVAMTSSTPANDSVSTVKLQDLAVSTAKIAADAVTFAKMQNITSDRLIGRDTAAAGDPEELTVGGGLEFTGSGGIQRSALSGDVTATAGSNATTIAANAVTYAKLQQVSNTKRAVGRNTAGAGNAEEVTAEQILNWIGTPAQGDVFYQGATNAARLAAGTNNQFLKSQGAGAAPLWAWGALVQQVADTDTAVATGTTAIPYDDSIPQNTEGDEYLSVSITPKNASHTLIVDVTVHVSHSASTPVTAAVFRDDSGADAVAATTMNCTAGEVLTIRLQWFVTAGSTSAITFSVRIGGATGATLTFNGNAGARRLGGVSASSLLIQETSI